MPASGSGPGHVGDDLADRSVVGLNRLGQCLGVHHRGPSRDGQDVDSQEREVGRKEHLRLDGVGVVPFVRNPESQLDVAGTCGQRAGVNRDVSPGGSVGYQGQHRGEPGRPEAYVPFLRRNLAMKNGSLLYSRTSTTTNHGHRERSHRAGLGVWRVRRL